VKRQSHRYPPGFRGAAILLAAAAAGPALAQSPLPSLADRFAGDALVLAEAQPLTVAALDGAVLLLEEAVALDPADADLWRMLADLAALAERDDLQEAAVTSVCELDPEDEGARWRRILLALARHQTVEARIEHSMRLLDGRAALGNAVASRLAFDVALLHRRRGDERRYADLLALAVALDPGHRAAAAATAEYVGRNLTDPYGQAELLLNAVVADPTALGARVTLGRLLLESAAFAGAERMLSSVVAVTGPRDQALVADLAIAQWAVGRERVALETIRRAQAEVDLAHREALRNERPDMSALDLAYQSAPLSPVLATVRAAIQLREGDAEAAASLTRVIESYDRALGEARSASPAQAQAEAELHLELALVLAWLGGDLQRVEQEVGSAAALVPLSDGARARFDGWIALRQGRLEDARAALQPLVADDPAARLGFGLLLLERGERAAGGRELLDVARAQPGTLIGAWAADRLFDLLGQRPPLHRDAARMDALVAAVPAAFDRYLEQPSTCVSIQVTPQRPTVAPYAPIMVDVEITNNSLHPIAIDADGPLRRTILLEASARIAQVTRVGDLKPVVIDIGRRLTLKPRERLVVPIDLRRARAGQLLNELPLLGALIKVKATSNFQVTEAGAFVPGVLGTQVMCRPFRVDGVRFSRRWIEDTMASLVQPGQADLASMSMLSHLAAAGLAAQLGADEQRLFGDAVQALVDTFPRLDPGAQAWLLGAMRRSPATAEILAIARRSEHRLVKFAYLVYCLEGVNDPMIDAARRDADARVRQMAEVASELFRQRQASPPAP
jgi:hypothetical protein